MLCPVCSHCKTFLGNSLSAFDREIDKQAQGWYLEHTCEFNGAAFVLLHTKYLEIMWFCAGSPAGSLVCRADVAVKGRTKWKLLVCLLSNFSGF